MSDKIVLNAEKRTVTGKKVKKLREKGIIPANIFGNKFTSQSIQVTLADFMKVFKAAGETQVVYIALDKEEVPTLVRGLQLHHLTNKPLHVDFQKVDLTKKSMQLSLYNSSGSQKLSTKILETYSILLKH